jgi:hypothetical protein
MEPEAPRIYASFDAFEHDERRRLGLPEIPAELAVVHVPKTLAKRRAAFQPASRVTPASLREEGVLEIGCAPGTSVLFVQTKKKLHLLHAASLPDRQLDDYAVMLAVNWIEDHGLPSCKVAQNLGVNETTLRKALADAGYARISPAQQQGLVHARAARKFGNRRGRLARVSAAPPA